MAAPIRHTIQLAGDRWLTKCAACPKRLGGRTFHTEQAADDWWAQHVETSGHKAAASRDRKLTPEEALLLNIFGKQPAQDDWRVAPNERSGSVTRRAGKGWYRDDDNPRGSEVCSGCHGDGALHTATWGDVTCPTCGGKGQVRARG